MNLYQHAKNQFISSVHSSDPVSFRVACSDWPHPFFDYAHPKNFQSPFNLREFVPACKKSVIPTVYSWDTFNFRVSRPDWPHPVLTLPNQKVFDQLLTFVNLYQQAKNKAVSLFFSGGIVDLNILKFNWLRAFWPLSQKQDISQIWDLCKNTVNNINFHYWTNSVKINDQIF